MSFGSIPGWIAAAFQLAIREDIFIGFLRFQGYIAQKGNEDQKELY